MVLSKHLDVDLGRKILRLGDRGNDNWWHTNGIKKPVFQSVRQADEITWDLEDAFHELGMHPGKMSPEIRELAFQKGYKTAGEYRSISKGGVQVRESAFRRGTG